MAAKALLDFAFLTSRNEIMGAEEIRRINPQRHEMEHLNAVIHLDKENQIAAGYKDVTDQEFWVRGHLPDRPLLPGVVMIEAGAQMCSICFHNLVDSPHFFGFAAVNDVRFRGTVVPGNRLYLIAQALDVRQSRGYFQTQGFVDGRMAFEAKVLGMAV